MSAMQPGCPLAQHLLHQRARQAQESRKLISCNASRCPRVFYLETLRRQLPRIAEGGSLASVLEHCMYCGMSLGRVGLDFRGLLVPLFEQEVLRLFSTAVKVRSRPYGTCSCNLRVFICSISWGSWCHSSIRGCSDCSAPPIRCTLCDVPTASFPLSFCWATVEVKGCLRHAESVALDLLMQARQWRCGSRFEFINRIMLCLVQTAAEMFVMVLDVHKWVPMPAIAARAKQGASSAVTPAGLHARSGHTVVAQTMHAWQSKRTCKPCCLWELLSLSISSFNELPYVYVDGKGARQCSHEILILAADGEDAGPPYSLLEHMPLAVFTNGLLQAFNELRHCALLSLSSPVAQIVQVRSHSSALFLSSMSIIYLLPVSDCLTPLQDSACRCKAGMQLSLPCWRNDRVCGDKVLADKAFSV